MTLDFLFNVMDKIVLHISECSGHFFHRVEDCISIFNVHCVLFSGNRDILCVFHKTVESLALVCVAGFDPYSSPGNQGTLNRG